MSGLSAHLRGPVLRELGLEGGVSGFPEDLRQLRDLGLDVDLRFGECDVRHTEKCGDKIPYRVLGVIKTTDLCRCPWIVDTEEPPPAVALGRDEDHLRHVYRHQRLPSSGS